MVHFQKRRKKKRKGYAEYAIIPKQRENSLNLDDINLESERNSSLQNSKLFEKKDYESTNSLMTVNLNEHNSLLKINNDSINSLTPDSIKSQIKDTIESSNQNSDSKIIKEVLKDSQDKKSNCFTGEKSDNFQKLNDEESLTFSLENKSELQNNENENNLTNSIILSEQQNINHTLSKSKYKDKVLKPENSEVKSSFSKKENSFIMENNKLDLNTNIPQVHKNVYTISKSENISNTNNLNELPTATSTNFNQNISNSDNHIFENNNLKNLYAEHEENIENYESKIENAVHLNNNEKTNFHSLLSETDEFENNSLIVQNLESELLSDSNDNSKNKECPSPLLGKSQSQSLSTEVLIRETEMELNKLHQLTFDSNHTIYKLAYDDQSEPEDNDNDIIQPSNKEKFACPKYCKNLQIQPEAYHSEIIIHEVDSASDAGSEDVELLPHRYESDTSKGCNKHVYVNNLSLAVELLRTRESLPYDHEFKRIVDDDSDIEIENQGTGNIKNNVSGIVNMSGISGKLNSGFVEETPSSSGIRQNQIFLTSHTKSQQHCNVIQNEPENRIFKKSTADSGVQSEDSENEIGDEFKKTSTELNSSLDDNNENTSTRQLNSQARQRFKIYASRTSVMNPCFCCSIM